MTGNASVDYLVVGSGLTGSVIARLLTQKGHSVVIAERRNHPGGNVHDSIHESGIRIHTYGPHLFRTSSKRIWDFVNSFAKFYIYEHRVKTLVDGIMEAWPIQNSYVQENYGEGWEPQFKGAPSNFEQACLSMMPAGIYRQFVKGYTEKQWGAPAASLDSGLAKRFEVRANGDTRLMRAKYQGLPVNGYAHFMKSLIKNIPLVLNFDYLENRQAYAPKKGTIFTGPIDAFFNYKHGKLMYRAQTREHEYLEDIQRQQEAPVINNPSPAYGRHIRTIEWKQMMETKYRQKIIGTVLTREIPYTRSNPGEYEYPFPVLKNLRLARKYEEEARNIDNLLICGRLGEYRYYDMDQAIARAMMLVKKHFPPE